MTIYKLVIEGKNCWADFDGTPDRLGFFTTRVVKASDTNQAKEIILRELSIELQSRLLNDPLDPPEITVNEVSEIELSAASTIANAGFTWYREETPTPT
ncbi:MAG: hypothetical protein QM706_20705 [Nitrospira sp.]